jgi:hypothetical protein
MRGVGNPEGEEDELSAVSTRRFVRVAEIQAFSADPTDD